MSSKLKDSMVPLLLNYNTKKHYLAFEKKISCLSLIFKIKFIYAYIYIYIYVYIFDTFYVFPDKIIF